MKTQKFNFLKYVILILLFISFVGCRNSEIVSGQTTNVAEKEIYGVWNLKSVAEGAPDKINIKTWRVEFSPDGKWSYSGEMSGQFEGMQLKGSGIYKISNNEFQYTAGENSGKSIIELKDGLLILSPDPVIKPNGGKQNVKTKYEPAK